MQPADVRCVAELRVRDWGIREKEEIGGKGVKEGRERGGESEIMREDVKERK